MPEKISQYRRLFSFETPLGAEKLMVQSFQGKEAISEPFHYILELVSDSRDINIAKFIGVDAKFSIHHADENEFRYFNGRINRAQAHPPEGRLAYYTVELVPWIWFLTKTQDNRIYQNMTVPEVIQDVFKRFGFTDYRFELRFNSRYEKWEYLTQYRESSFDFISRLMETEGIFYFFEQTEGRHSMVIADAPAAHLPCPYQSKFTYEKSFGKGYRRAEDTTFSWEVEKQFRSGKYTYRDYNFTTPANNLQAEVPSRVKRAGNNKFEIYDYPGEYEDARGGDNWTKLRMEEEEVEEHLVLARSNGRALIPGYRFDLERHDRTDQNQSYVVVSMVHHASEDNPLSDEETTPSTYSNSFTCIPFKVPFRPGRKTPKHLARGLQTATVVGPSGEEIYCDKYGRVKVQFHWDREGKKDENSSCWMRVSQIHAGSGFGAMFIPRIGQEVIVDFLEGDPDRPIITGCVYNASQMPPWELPKRMNWSGIKTRSTKSGGVDNANELRFDDTKGEELFLMRAERDMEITVERHLHEEISGNRHYTLSGNSSADIAGHVDLSIGGNRTQSIGGNQQLDIGANRTESVGASSITSAGMDVHIIAGKRIVLEAGVGVTLIGGGSHVDISPKGVVIQGTMVFLNCGTPHSGPAEKKKPEKSKKPEKPARFKDK